MNIELLRQIQDKIRQYPESFNMITWHSSSSCGTTHCIGGWCDVLSYPDKEFVDDPCYWLTGKERQVLLDISIDQYVRLCHADKWPKQFQGTEIFPAESRYSMPSLAVWNVTPEQAIARIDHFINTNGAE